MDIEEFQLAEKIRKTIFAMFVIFATELGNVYMILNSTDVIDIQLLKKYEDYADIFLKAEISKFPEFICIKYMISMKEDKKMSFELIYRLSENELGILCKYLANNMEKRGI